MKRYKMCIDSQFDRIERMLKYIILDRFNDKIEEACNRRPPLTGKEQQEVLEILWKKPDISDILKEGK